MCWLKKKGAFALRSRRKTEEEKVVGEGEEVWESQSFFFSGRAYVFCLHAYWTFKLEESSRLQSDEPDLVCRSSHQGRRRVTAPEKGPETTPEIVSRLRESLRARKIDVEKALVAEYVE